MRKKALWLSFGFLASAAAFGAGGNAENGIRCLSSKEQTEYIRRSLAASRPVAQLMAELNAAQAKCAGGPSAVDGGGDLENPDIVLNCVHGRARGEFIVQSLAAGAERADIASELERMDAKCEEAKKAAAPLQ